MEHVCVIVSGCSDMVEFIQDGLIGSENTVLRVCATADDCRSFIADGEWSKSPVRVLVDTYVDLQLPAAGGPAWLDGESPSTKLMHDISTQCERWVILAITRSGCKNDAEIALQHKPRWFSHSSDFETWHKLLPGVLERAEEFHALEKKAAARSPATFGRRLYPIRV